MLLLNAVLRLCIFDYRLMEIFIPAGGSQKRCGNRVLRRTVSIILKTLIFIGRSAENRMVIWGTDVVVEESREKFMKFITQYICPEFDEQGNIINV